MNNKQLKTNTITEIYLHQFLLAVRTPHYVAMTQNIAMIGRDTAEMPFAFDFARFWETKTASLSSMMEDIWHMCLDHIEENPKAVVTVADAEDMYVFSFGDLPMLRAGAAN
ncbi:MAG: hypothetical protein IPJ76_01245 [Flavobacteriales bacterium]|nr:MAG: hypothetical protein IPJ76_01245 [Flavobacteriales bacterium]